MIAVPIMVFFALVLTLLALRFNKVHDGQACYKVYLSDSMLERDLKDSKDQYLLTDINSIRVKRTSKKTIREIKFYVDKGKYFYINGISSDEFESFIDHLIDKNPSITVRTLREPPVDFDHWLFYPVLGVILGVISSLLYRVVINVDENIQVYIKNGISVYIILIGIFFIIDKPTKRRYGNKRKLAVKDSLFGICLIIMGSFYIAFM